MLRLARPACRDCSLLVAKERLMVRQLAGVIRSVASTAFIAVLVFRYPSVSETHEANSSLIIKQSLIDGAPSLRPRSVSVGCLKACLQDSRRLKSSIVSKTGD